MRSWGTVLIAAAALLATAAGAMAIDFSAPASYEVEGDPYAIAVADFNGDGHQDVAVGNQEGQSVSVLLGRGNGTFRAARTSAAGDYPFSLVPADFNHDGHQDLAVAEDELGGGVSILIGKGNGRFEPPRFQPTGDDTVFLGKGNFNGDRFTDLAATNELDDNVSVLLGKKGAKFKAPVGYPAGTMPEGLQVRDFDGDGRADLATLSQDGFVNLLRGRSNGTFKPALHSASSAGGGYGLAAGDFNRDGRLDLIAAGCGIGNIYFLRGKGNGRFAAPVPHEAGSCAYIMATGDFNRDRKLDLVATDDSDGSVDLLRGKGNGDFKPALNFPAANGSDAYSVAKGSFNGDKHLDLAVPGYGSANLKILLGRK
ncbi:MAG: VCBS repeat-containing protein [Solirubrobacterales bacterium]|nr:VCBS repeat-containing protein [Solirubrobacterales bacterium]